MFFLEIVSTLCFGGEITPEPDLIKMLLDIIFKENKDSKSFNTQEITPLIDEEVDKSPVIRSSLLQLLLEQGLVIMSVLILIIMVINLPSPNDVREYLDEHFDRSQKVLAGDVDEYLCLLYIQCFEVWNKVN